MAPRMKPGKRIRVHKIETTLSAAGGGMGEGVMGVGGRRAVGEGVRGGGGAGGTLWVVWMINAVFDHFAKVCNVGHL